MRCRNRYGRQPFGCQEVWAIHPDTLELLTFQLIRNDKIELVLRDLFASMMNVNNRTASKPNRSMGSCVYPKQSQPEIKNDVQLIESKTNSTHKTDIDGFIVLIVAKHNIT